MARKITVESVDALMGGYKLNKANMSVVPGVMHSGLADRVDFQRGDDAWTMELHGNPIAVRHCGSLWVSDGGWETNTTRERLNGLPGVSVHQSKGIQYLNGLEWDGAWAKVS